MDFDPQAGYEQRGRRPAIVVSNSHFNRYSKTVLVCPITHTDKNHPFHVRLNEGANTSGVVLCDQIKALDITARAHEFIEKAPKTLVLEVIDIINSFMEIEG